MTLSDRIVLLRRGKIEQVDTPRGIYNRPRTAYAATFIGQTNLLRARVENGTAKYAGFEWPFATEQKEVLFSLRPEHIRIANGNDPAPPGSMRCEGSVQGHIFSGASELLEVDCGAGLMLKVRVPNQDAQLQNITLEVPSHSLVPVIETDTE